MGIDYLQHWENSRLLSPMVKIFVHVLWLEVSLQFLPQTLSTLSITRPGSLGLPDLWIAEYRYYYTTVRGEVEDELGALVPSF